MQRIWICASLVVLLWCASSIAQESTGVVRDRVKGSINHGNEKTERARISGKVKVIDASTVEFADGTRLDLGFAAPQLLQQGVIDGKLYPCGKHAAEYLHKLVGDQTIACIMADKVNVLSAYVGDTNLEHEMVIQGWALATHSLLHTAEIRAREQKRGLWRGEFVKPKDWREGKRLPEEKTTAAPAP